MRSLKIIVSLLTLPAVSTFADDFAPPDFRGGICSVHARWEFDSPQWAAPTDWFSITTPQFPFTDDTAPALQALGQMWEWAPGIRGRGVAVPRGQGQWGEFMEPLLVHAPSNANGNWYRIQVTLDGPHTFEVAWVGSNDPANPSATGNRVSRVDVDSRHFYEDWYMPGRVGMSFIALAYHGFGGPEAAIDEIVVDETSIPTPGAIALLGAGLLASTRVRR